MNKNYGITRIDQPEKKNFGYYVRVTRNGKTYPKFFPDKSSGGKAKALKLARAFRDDLVAKLGEPTNRRKNVPKSDIVGVTHTVNKVGDKTYAYWQAKFKDQTGRKRIVKFSVRELGNEAAKDAAEELVVNSQV